MIGSLRQIQAFVAIVEEGSFTAAATREGATQSGMSQHLKLLERRLGVALLGRDGRRVVPTAAGRRYYDECVAALRKLDAAGATIATVEKMGGEVRAGLMPTFTRAVLAPALRVFLEQSGGVGVKILEAYSGVLTDKVRAGELDFAIVPSFALPMGLRATRIVTNREMLVTRAGRTGKHLEPVRLADLGPLDIVLPGPLNTRRQSIETYIGANGVDIRSRLEAGRHDGNAGICFQQRLGGRTPCHSDARPSLMVASLKEAHFRSQSGATAREPQRETAVERNLPL